MIFQHRCVVVQWYVAPEVVDDVYFSYPFYLIYTLVTITLLANVGLI